MDNELRALIVARLRAEADRVDAGGNVTNTWWEAGDDADVESSAEAARDVAAAWCDDDDVDPAEIRWGLRVTVERARLVGIARCTDLVARDPSVVRYALVRADQKPTVEIDETDCPQCGLTEAVPPGGTCSDCGYVDDGELPDGVTL